MPVHPVAKCTALFDIPIPRRNLICIEGLNFAGKSTQISLLEKALTAIGYSCQRPKTDHKKTVAGKALREVFAVGQTLDPVSEALLFICDLRESMYTHWCQRTQDDSVFLVDRYQYSCEAYQGEQGVHIEFIQTLGRCLPVPGLTILLDIDVTTAMNRSARSGRSPIFTEEFLRGVRRRYLQMADRGDMIVIDGRQSIEQVSSSVLRVVIDHLDGCEQMSGKSR